MTLSSERSKDALASLAAAFDGDIVRTAASVVRVANANMERAVRVISVERGYDPRLYTLVAFGGAGPLHACDLATSLGIPRVLVPPFPGVLSAFGMVAAAPTRDFSQAIMSNVPAQPGERWHTIVHLLAYVYEDMRAQATAQLAADGLDPNSATLQVALDMRYTGQSYEITVPVESLSPGYFLERFHAAHKERYGHSDPTRSVDLVNVRLKVVSATNSPTMPRLPTGDGDITAAVTGESQVWFDEMVMSKIYDRERLRAGHRFDGPAIVVQMDATTAIPPGWQATVDARGNLVLETK
jgi:N-methylhydantoinase A